jgi:hypothetical protein
MMTGTHPTIIAYHQGRGGGNSLTNVNVTQALTHVFIFQQQRALDSGEFTSKVYEMANRTRWRGDEVAYAAAVAHATRDEKEKTLRPFSLPFPRNVPCLIRAQRPRRPPSGAQAELAAAQLPAVAVAAAPRGLLGEHHVGDPAQCLLHFDADPAAVALPPLVVAVQVEFEIKL